MIRLLSIFTFSLTTVKQSFLSIVTSSIIFERGIYEENHFINNGLTFGRM